MNQNDLQNNTPSKKDKMDTFWFLFFFIILPLLGVVIELIALKIKNIILLLLALPMLLSFFITAGVIFFKAFKTKKKIDEETATEEKPDAYYETYLNINEDALLAYKKNPYKKVAVKSFVIIMLSIFVPILLAYALKDTEWMIFGYYVKNIFKALPILLGLWSVSKGWHNLADFFEFRRAKKVLLCKQEGKKNPFLFPRIDLLSLLFFLLTIVMLVISIKDISTLNDYKKNGVAVDAVSYHVEKDGEDNYVYFKYTYEGKEYSYVKKNYAGGTKIGNEVEAYLLPHTPEELFIYYSNTFAVYIMLTGGLFFLWMNNGYKKSLLAACLLAEGLVAITLGFAAGTAGNKVWGTIFLICALLTWRSCKKKPKE